ncbi:Gfo/Idh/MocA family oxidoreductase [Halobacteria archaeon AArc-dxtr1]|nr:Gfo/Idh/MocA family oxidoreductase [Halobacteria archaeon AArc-dxtr1]
MTVSVGLLSAAHVHTEVYAELLSEHDDATLHGVTDINIEQGRETADQHDTQFVSDADELLDQIDAAVICSPNVDHRDWFERAAAADVDVLCEKPLATTASEAESMVETWRESGINAGVAMPLRFCEPARLAKETIADNGIGSVLSLSGTNRGLMPGGWFVDPEAAGGGAVMDHTVHIVDLVAHLLGEWPAEVYAEVGTRMHDIDVEDVNVLSMELADGTPFLLDGSWSKPDTWHTWGDATLEITGAEGALSIDCTGRSIEYTVESGPKAGINRESYGTSANAGLIDDFVAAVRDGRNPQVTPEQGLQAVRVVEAAYESADAQAPVPIQR